MSITQQLFIMRHAERIDLTFEQWMSTSFTKDGKYVRTDLNMPISLPQRINYPTSYKDDTPITNLGLLESKLTGEALLDSKVTIKYAFSSPALRSVQTCDYVLQGLGIKDTVPIRIEPALFEWLIWYHPNVPEWLTTTEYVQAGFNIDTSYKPFLTREDLQHLVKESCEQYYTRNYNFEQQILKDIKGDNENILLVGHGPSLDACSRELRGLPPRTAGQLNKILHKVHYCNLIQVYRNGDKWDIAESPVPYFSNAINKPFDWKVLNEE